MSLTRRQPLLWLLVLVASMLAGLGYDAIFDIGKPLAGAVYGICIALPLIAFESGALWPDLQRRIRLFPTLLAILASEALYVALITAGFGAAGLVLWSTGVVAHDLAVAILPSGRVLLYSLAVSAVVVSFLRVRDLIGREVFLSLVIGRYHRPVREERVFLFVDLVGSTRFAEAHGDLRAQDFLGAFFAALADPVRSARGSVDDYVGDMALITWPLARGVKDGACVACVVALEEAIAREAATWRERFGLVPHFRAALHAGPVVTAEIGVDRHKIAYFGDTVNVTGRMEALAKALDAKILISADLLDRIPALPDGICARPLGEHALRGRNQPLAVAALERAGAGAAPGRRPAHAAAAAATA